MSDDPVVEGLGALAAQFDRIADELGEANHPAPPPIPPDGLVIPTWAAGTILAAFLGLVLGFGAAFLDMRDEMSTGFATINVQIRDIFERRMDSQSDRISEQSDEIQELEDRFEDHLQQYHNGSGR